jgi:hypothetical protein
MAPAATVSPVAPRPAYSGGSSLRWQARSVIAPATTEATLLTASAGRRRRGSRSARSGAADCFLQMQKSGFPLPPRLCRDLMVRRPARRPGRRSCPRATPLIRLSAPRWRPGRKPPTRPRQASQPLGRRRECPPAHARCRRRGLVCVCGGGVALATRAQPPLCAQGRAGGPSCVSAPYLGHLPAGSRLVRRAAHMRPAQSTSRCREKWAHVAGWALVAEAPC